MKPDDRFKVEVRDDEVILTCKSAVKDDTGKWQVTLKNAKGSDSCNVNVNVLGMSSHL